jgi:hypothetical protein
MPKPKPQPREARQKRKARSRKPKITISYRRDDTSAISARIAAELQEHYGKGVAFIDIDHLPPGVDFRDHIKSQIACSDVLLAIVGPGWIGARRWGRKPRVHDRDDWVRTEIAAALETNIQIIPVLIDNSTMPRPNELPKDIEPFSYRNAVCLHSTLNFQSDMKRLIRSLPKRPPKTRPVRGREEPKPPPSVPKPIERTFHVQLPIRVHSHDGDPRTVNCNIDRDAWRDLIAHHKAAGSQEESTRVLLPKIESLAAKIYNRRGLEKNGELAIRSRDLVQFGFG